MYVDSDHGGDQVTRRSRTGFLVFLNSSLIYWCSKKQTTIETSSFGSEFMALKHATEYVRGFRYKLRAMGIPVTQPAYVYGDNKSVLANSTVPESQLKKKSNSVAYHHCREGVALDEWRTAYCSTNDNGADMMTKCLPGGSKRDKFVNMVLKFFKKTDDPDAEITLADAADAIISSLKALPSKWITGFTQALTWFENQAEDQDE